MTHTEQRQAIRNKCLNSIAKVVSGSYRGHLDIYDERGFGEQSYGYISELVDSMNFELKELKNKLDTPPNKQ
jgi:hypothetical protein